MNFPSSPTVNQIYTQGSRSWKWNGVAWALQPHTLQASDIPNLDASQITTGTLSSTLLPALTGDVSTSAGSNATVLATVNSNVGVFGDAAHVAAFTVNAKGLTTAASNVAIAIDASQVTTGTIAAARMPAYTGDVTSPAGSTVNTLATVNANVGTYGSTATIPVVTVNGKGLVTGVGTAALGNAAVANTGTSGHLLPFLDGLNTWSAVNIYSAKPKLMVTNSTGNAEWLNFTPTDYGVGAPYLYVKKMPTATVWEVGLYDSATNNGTINLNASVLQKQGSNVMTVATSVASTQMPALTGDVTTTAGTVATTLATVNTNTGTWGSATQVPQFVVNGKGLVTSASNVTVTPAWGSITSIPAGVTSLAGLTGAGVVTATGTGVLAMQYLGAANSTDIPNIAAADTRYVQLGGSTMTGLLTLSGDPTTALGAATKQYVDNSIQGLSAKQSARAASASNITLSGLQTIDGVALAVNDRVLVMGQTTTSQNGIYVVSSGSWVRSADMSTWAEVTGAFVFIEQGTQYSATGWVCTSQPGGTLGTTGITFVQFSSAGSYTASNGVTLVGQNIQLTGQALTLNNFSTVGLMAYQGAGAFTGVSLAVGSGLSILNANAVSGNPTISPAGELAAVQGLATTGYAKRTGTATWVAQSIPDSDLPTTLTAKTFSGQITSTVATGTAPFSVASTTQVNNLNAQYLGGNAASYYTNASNINAGTISTNYLPTNINALTLGGQQGSYYTNATNINAGVIADTYLPTSQSGKTFTSAVSITAGVPSTSTTTGSLIVTGGVGISGALNAATKSFLVPHPTKAGMTLRHGSLEGPEFGVYVRGRLKDNGVIDLPDYWEGLVDPDTITVQLTPVGHDQKLYVDRIEDNRVHVTNGTMFYRGIDCFYLVMAERKDVEKIIVESPAE